MGIDKHLPGYVHAYFGPEDWKARVQQDGKQPLSNLTDQINQLAKDISQADALDPQRTVNLLKAPSAVMAEGIVVLFLQ